MSGAVISAPGAVDATTPVAGFFRMKLRGGGVLVGIRIWHGAPCDPVTGEEMDRSWRWQAECNGEPIDFDRVWPQCAGDPITEAEYRAYAQRQTWAREKAPETAFADPQRRHDPLTAMLPF
jgi:hypothetical protein